MSFLFCIMILVMIAENENFPQSGAIEGTKRLKCPTKKLWEPWRAGYIRRETGLVSRRRDLSVKVE